MKRFLSTIFLLSLLLNFAEANTPPVKEDGITWYTFEEVLEKNSENPRKVFVDIYTDWCGWCKRMDQTTFKNAAVVDLLNTDYYAVKLNAESNDKVTINGEQKSYREIAKDLKASGYPTTAYLDEQMQVIQSIPGYQQADQLEMILSYFGGDHHKNGTPWPEFQKNFKSGN